MSMIKAENLTFSYPGSFDNIFENACFQIDSDWKLGFIGRNGRGKTTFLNLLLGKYEYSGKIISDLQFDYFPYEVSDKSRMTLDIVSEISSAQDWEFIRELNYLEVDAEVLYRPFETLSNGEQTKVLLAALFLNERHFLLIDEPTNHLDTRARVIVSDYLKKKKGFILVSHDRHFLDGCVDHILSINRMNIEVQNGNFSSWWENKKYKDQFAIAEDEKHRKEIKKLKQAAKRTAEWAEKSESTKIGFDPIKEHDRSISTRSYIGSKTKKMQSRVKHIEKRTAREIEKKEGLLGDIERIADLKLNPMVHHKNTLVYLHDYSLTYSGADCAVLNNISFTVNKSDRIALDGRNGCGKSTLIKRILQQSGIETSLGSFTENGICETASGLIISYISQDTSFLQGSIWDFCEEKRLDRAMFGALLRQLDFERIQFTKDMSNFSEGQKKKVLIASSLLTPAHLYIWDEPLNFIDIYSRMQIEKLLTEYTPTMIFVEHDKAFRETIATKVIQI